MEAEARVEAKPGAGTGTEVGMEAAARGVRRVRRTTVVIKAAAAVA
jgi:hypothetical protein